MARRRKRRKKDSLFGDLFGRLARAVIAVAVLTAFVLAIAYGVKTLSSLNGKDLAGFAAPYLAKIGLEERQIGEVAGSVFEMLGDLDIEGMTTSKNESVEEQENTNDSALGQEVEARLVRLAPEGDVIATVALIADSHIANDLQKYKNNKDHLRRALAQASDGNAEKVIHVGDITNFGVYADLKESKEILEASEVSYLALPGDHDLAATFSPENFIKVFGKPNSTFKVGSQKFLLLDNSANYTLISEEDMTWFRGEVEDTDIVILSQPLFTDGLILFNYLYMGSTDDVPAEGSLAELQAAVLAQRNELLTLIRSSDVKAVFAGDHHYSSNITDPVRATLEHYVVGAISGTIGTASQSILQAQRFSTLSIYGNGAYTVEVIPLNIALE